MNILPEILPTDLDPLIAQLFHIFPNGRIGAWRWGIVIGGHGEPCSSSCAYSRAWVGAIWIKHKAQCDDGAARFVVTFLALFGRVNFGCDYWGNIVVTLSSNVIQVTVGVFIIWTVLSKQPRWLSQMPFLTMFFGVTGPFVGSYVRSLNLSRMGFSGTHAVLMMLQHVLKTTTFVVLGFPFLDWLGLIGAMILFGFLGTYLVGKALIRRSDANFQMDLSILLVLVSIRLIYKGIMG